MKISALKTLTNENQVEQIVADILQLADDIHYYHWNTYSYSTHKTSDKLYEYLREAIDEFVECYKGSDNSVFFVNPLTQKEPSSIRITDRTALADYITEATALFKDLRALTQSDTALASLIDDILGELAKFRYLSRLV